MTTSNSGLSGEHLFLGLVTDLVTQAWIALGKIKNPANDKIERNVPAAAMLIDMLDMLASKTAGNRSPEEDRILTESLQQLKLNYVAEEEKPAEAADANEDKTGADAATESTDPSSQENNDA